MAKKSISRISHLFWRIVITIIGGALVIIAIAQLLLFFFGATTAADISARRQGGANDGATPNRRYKWSVGYTFVDQHGSVNQGHTMLLGSDTAVYTGEMVYYFPFAPYINTLEADARPGFGQPLYVAAGLFLIRIINKKKKSSETNKTVKSRHHPTGLTDYDDSVEEQFHE